MTPTRSRRWCKTCQDTTQHSHQSKGGGKRAWRCLACLKRRTAGYAVTTAGKARTRRYNASPKGKAARQRYRGAEVQVPSPVSPALPPVGDVALEGFL